MRVLVTGSAGFVGSHLVERIMETTDWKPIGLDSFKHRGDSERLAEFPPYPVFYCDLSAPVSYRLLSKLGQIDVIVNMASASHVDTSISEPVPFIQNNVNLALNVLQMSRVLKPKLFIQVSTDEVYGPAPEATLHKEWSPILPSNPYAASKAAQEAIAVSYWRTFGVPLVITNTMNMFGERQDKEKFIPLCISKIYAGEKVYIHGTDTYIGRRFYLHASNFADALIFLMKNHEARRYEDTMQLVMPDRFNVVGEIEMNNLEVAQTIAKIMRKELVYELVDFHKARPGHDRRYALDGTKIAQRGWKQPMNFEQSLEKSVLWTLENSWWML